MAELKMAKMELEQEVDTHKKRIRLHMEAQVRTRYGENVLNQNDLKYSYSYYALLKVMEDHRVCQAKIVDALEAEKRKISKELEDMQKRRALRENHTPRNGKILSHCYILEFGSKVPDGVGYVLLSQTHYNRDSLPGCYITTGLNISLMCTERP